MKCPKCGNELKEGHLICEVCGEEIRIVPDFEPEIENSITETLSTLAAMQEGEGAKTDTTESVELAEEEDESEPEEQVSSSRKTWAFVSLGVILLILFVSFITYIYRTNSVEYQIDRAKEYAAREAYPEAIACLEAAYEKYPEEAEILFLEADYYYLQQDNDSALTQLMKIIEDGSFSHEDVEEAYDKVITIYANQGQYAQINELLQNCTDTQIVSIFQSYMAMPPEFSYVEGSYTEVIPLKLSSNTSGTIYYTMDGSTPDENSMIYTAPLFLETGEYTVSAVFINDYGIESEVVSNRYVINLEVPNAPEVALYSGEYTEPTMITVEGTEGCQIYYTTDESEPTADSVPYTGPIPMPLGKTLFKFVNISEDGIASEVTMRTYNLTLRGAISTGQAVNSLVEQLVESGYLKDSEGHNERMSGMLSYKFSSVLRIGDSDDYYTIYEYYDDGTGIQNRTDKVFLVQIYTGQAAQLGYDDDGNFVAVSI
jgi:uncharacterized Zn finger protein (UPF0148 family)